MPLAPLQRAAFLLVLGASTLAFGALLLPFFQAVFWAVTLAIVFAPAQERLLLRVGGRRHLAAGLTLLVCVVSVILPLLLIGSLVAREIADAWVALQSGQLSPARALRDILALLPDWLARLLERHGLDDVGSLRDKLSASALRGGPFLFNRTLLMGQGTLHFLIGLALMLYLLFFLLRDGRTLAARLRAALPLPPLHRDRLLGQATAVVRATIKGNFVVAVVQGTLGGLAFALLGIGGAVLWGAVMALLSLLPAFGAALVWGPVALWLLAGGDALRGLALLGFGLLVIGLVDNLLRPVLVGRDTCLPDYVVLVSTLGGIALFGLSGFVLGPLLAGVCLAGWELFAQEQGPPG